MSFIYFASFNRTSDATRHDLRPGDRRATRREIGKIARRLRSENYRGLAATRDRRKDLGEGLVGFGGKGFYIRGIDAWDQWTG